ncbi:MAG: radical SAM protein [Candidatus Heimdallarchaeota archaeon]|nr:radical SAM protein [Candidatus Heimdallarchaeota archaeon]
MKFILKKLVLGSTDLILQPGSVQFPEKLKPLGLYLHVPFCKTICDYCPYNKVPYTSAKMELYLKALYQEINRYKPIINDTEITSLYIGGGTPTIDYKILCKLITDLRDEFQISGDICTESHPTTITEECVSYLREVGINKISIGIESLRDPILKKIGRSHNAQTAEQAITYATNQDFDTVNVDMLFALPGQTREILREDIQRVIELGVDQVSSYPLYVFPFTKFGKKVHSGEVKVPTWYQKFQLFKELEKTCLNNGLIQTSVWTFTKSLQQRYSSVTRERYIGFGPGAGSYIDDYFYLNTFSLRGYAEAVKKGLPIAVRAVFNELLQKIFWLYWKIYRVNIPTQDYQRKFNERFEGRFWLPSLFARAFNMAYYQNSNLLLTSRGSYWIHQLQNLFSLGSIDYVWGSCSEEAWPSKNLKI